jgi:hypothetical protein
MPSLLDFKEDTSTWSRRRCSFKRPKSRDYADLQSPSTPPAGAPTDLVERIMVAAGMPDPEDAVELIYREIDALLREGSFSKVDALLDAVDPSKLAPVHLLAFVSITSAASAHLRWSDFVARVRQRLAVIDPARVEELLAGFE